MEARFIPMDQLENGRVYKIQSRNLLLGAWVAKRRGFIGIREKFGERYLFMEFHHDADPHVGTVRPQHPYDVVVPADELDERSSALWDVLVAWEPLAIQEVEAEREAQRIRIESEKWAPETREQHERRAHIAEVRAKRAQMYDEAALIEDDEERKQRRREIHRWYVDALFEEG